MKSVLLHRVIEFLILTAFLSFLSGCARNSSVVYTEISENVTQENIDSSCSYFYFLWGSNAEYNESYAEALEAYEKASICDPKAEYIAEKIPVLLIQLDRMEEATAWLENYIRDRPNKTVQRFMLARLRIEEGKEEEAIDLYEEALGIDPNNNNIRLRLGLLYGKKDDFLIAKTIFLDILEQDKNSYFAHLYLARLHAKVGKLDQAEDYYQKTLKLNWSKELSFEIAEFYNLRKQFDKAQEIYSDILCKDNKDERAALGMVQTYLFLQDGEAALQELTRIRDFTNNQERIDLVRSQILINIGEIDRAKDILTALLKENQFAQANYLLGVIYYDELDFTSALQVFRKIPPNAPEFEESIIMQVRIFEENKKGNLSIELLQEVIDSEEMRLPIFFLLLSSVFERQDKNDEALQTLAKAIEIYPEDESILYEYAILLERGLDHEKAMTVMIKLLSLSPNHADALNFIGYSWADRNMYLDKAYLYIQKALELKPKSGYILDSLGWIYFRMGAYDKALTELEKALQLEPDDPYIYDHLGDTHRALGNKAKALEFYRKSIELMSDKIKSQSIQKKVDSLNE